MERIVHKIGLEKIKYKLMDKLDKFIPFFIASLPLFYFLPKHLRFVRRIQKGDLPNSYAIIQNDICGENFFILPVFIQEYYDNMDLLTHRPRFTNLKKKKFCVFGVSSNSSRERIKFFKELSKYKKVDSFGKVLNNIKIDIRDWHDNYKIFREYKFAICFENDFHKEYITEKITNVMFSGAIPIYRGASNIGNYFNTESFINYEDYGSYDKMINKVIELDKDDRKYQEFLRKPFFKNNKIPSAILEKEKELIIFYKKIIYSKISS